MSDEEAFLAAIAADPADDARRLVYADWLDEQDRHDQAELIRVEHRYRLAMARLKELERGMDSDWAARVFPANALFLLTYPPDRKIHVIKLIRELTGLWLADAKRLSESLPARLGGPLPTPVVERWRQLFAEVGADTEHRYVLPAAD